MSKSKNPGLTRRASGLMALEQRFMFDGAAVADALQVVETQVVQADVAKAIKAAEPLPMAVAQVQQQAQQKIADYLNGATDQQIFELFNGGKDAPDAAWADRLAELRDMLNMGELPVQFVAMDQASQFTAVAAFTMNGPDGKPTIFVNPFWAGLLDNQDMTQVVVEELGHWMDQVLNDRADTAGDEGERFAHVVTQSSAVLSADAHSNDTGWVQVDGVSYEVEFASFNFVNAYEMVYDRNNNTTSLGVVNGAIDTDERWASKEQNSHFFNASVSLGVVSISDGTNGQNFSGNDVSATTVVVGGNTYHGWISRPIKAGGVVRGFYFWTDTRFTTLALAQADGNQDGDSTVLNNRGFVFVVDQTWFNTQIAAGTPSVAINNTKDSNLGSITVANVGSSSDRVDSALNSVTSLVVNAAPVANADDATDAPNSTLSTGVGNAALEQGLNTNPNPDVVITASINGSGSVLFNDTDTNSDTLTVTTVSSKSTGTTAIPTTPGVNVTGQYGTLNIKSDGNWTYAPDNTNSAVNALLTGNLQEQFTYSISDGKGGTASATLTVQINGSNDAPVASDNYNFAKEITSTSNTGYTASAGALPDVQNVLHNDSDVDTGDTKTVTGIEVKGQATSTTINAVVGTATLSFTDVNNSIKSGDQFYVSISGSYNLVVRSDGTTPVKSTNQGGTSLDSMPSGYRDASGTYIPFGTTVTSFFNTNNQVAFNASNSANSTTYTFTPGNPEKNAIATASTSSYSTVSNLSGIAGTVAVGMTVSGGTGLPTGTKVSEVTYVGGVLTTIKLDQALTSAAGGTFIFTGTSALAQTIQGAHGTLVLDSNGSYTYTPTTDNPNLSIGQSAVDVFDYTVRDTAGATSAAKLFITIFGSGTNDPAVTNDIGIAKESGLQNGGNAIESGSPATGNVLANDKETSSAATNAIGTGYVSQAGLEGAGTFTTIDTSNDGRTTTNSATVNGIYGVLTLNDFGAYSYAISNSNATVDALFPGQTLTETFSYQVKNSLSGTTWAKLVVTIQGTNDAPVAVLDAAIVSEDNVLTASGNVLTNDTDVDAGDTQKVSRAGSASANTAVTVNTSSADGLVIAGTYGNLTLGADGTYRYVLATSGQQYIDLQALANGTSQNDEFAYEVKDTNGATSANILRITVAGANEAPINQFNSTAISSTSVTAVTTSLNTALDFTGSKLLSVSDVDTNLSSIVLEVEHGVLSLTTTPAVVTTQSTNGGKTITINAGTQAQLNAALALLRYTPDNNYAGSDFLSINSVDALSGRDIDGVAINIPTTTAATVSEPALSTGTNAGSSAETYSGSLTLGSGQTIGAQQTGSFRDGSNNVIGTWQVNTNGTFTVTLSSSSSATSSNFSYVSYDSFGNAVDNTVTLTITDDSPTANADTANVNEGSTTTGNVLTGGTADVFGADGAKVTTPAGGVVGVRAAGGDTTTAVTTGLGTSIVGLYGTLTLNANGSYSYAARANSASSAQNDVFVYTIEDADGSQSTATLTITVNDVPTAVTVSSPTVNEASLHAVFTVAATLNQNLSLALADGTANGASTDYGSSTTNLQYSLNGGLSWTDYTGAFNNALTGAGVTTGLLVRTPITNDTLPDNGETFTLTATPTGGTAALGTATINDDGTGDIFKADGTVDSAALKNDDRPITVTGGTYNEASPRALFTVTANNGQLLTLDVKDVADTGKNPTGSNTGTGDDLDNADIYYSVNGGATWVKYTGAAFAAGTQPVLVAVDITKEADIPYEGEEQLQLVVNTGLSTQKSSFSSIFDDGTGTVTKAITETTTNDTGANDPAVIKDDDRPITVTGLGDVSEGSNAIFTVTLPDGNTRATEISLVLSNERAIGSDYSTGITVYYLNNGAVVDLPVVNGKIMLPGGIMSFFVSVPTVSDTNFEGPEDFRLTATVTGGKSGSDTSTILDDGKGRIYDLLAANPAGPGDDDSPKPAPPVVLMPAPPASALPTVIAVTPVPAAPSQSFASALTPLAPSLVPADPPWSLVDAVTSGSGYQIPVSETAPLGLNLYQGVTDQFVQSTNAATRISLPFDAFIHSSKDAVIKLEAKLGDNSKLPDWVQFDPTAGVFIVTPPAGFKGKLDLKVFARDDDGREAVALFQMFVGEQTVPQAQSRDSFSEKLKMAGKRQITLVRVADGGHKAPVREAAAVRESAPARVRAG